VGIGTSSPAYKLDVVGRINATSDINIGTTAQAFMRFTVQSGATYIQSSTVPLTGIGAGLGNFAPIYFTGMGGSDVQMTLNTTGLGIGISAPQYKLDVNGGANIHGVLSKYASIANNGVFLRISDWDTTNEMIFSYNAKFVGSTWVPDNSGYGSPGDMNYSYFMKFSSPYSSGGIIFQTASYVRNTTNISPSIQPAFTIFPTGDVTARGNVTAYSDVRAKENIATIDSALDKVMALRGVYYTRKDNPGPRQVGVIAQEVEAILPEVVMTDSEGKKSVAYGNIVALLLEGMKEQQSTIKSLLSRI
jgi:hypothetical protein